MSTITRYDDIPAESHSIILNGQDLRGKDFRDRDLHGASLRNTNLSGANFHGADLRYADLSGADLTNARFDSANLCGACFHAVKAASAQFYTASLKNAILDHADFTWADFTETDLSRANCYGAVFTGAAMKGVKLTRASLGDARDLPDEAREAARIVPEAGAFLGYKKVTTVFGYQDAVATLQVPASAERSNATGRKCRAGRAKVVRIENRDGTALSTAYSLYNAAFSYEKGKTVVALGYDGKPGFDANWASECAPGIHFFMTKAEAWAYRL